MNCLVRRSIPASLYRKEASWLVVAVVQTGIRIVTNETEPAGSDRGTSGYIPPHPKAWRQVRAQFVRQAELVGSEKAGHASA
jgi:hypothetical protein